MEVAAMDLSALQAAIQQHDRLATTHALREALADSLDIGDIWASLADATCEVIEDYPTDPRGASCLLLSFVAGRPIHTVVAFPAPQIAAARGVAAVAVLITVYRPDLAPGSWSADYRTRAP
jgi:hypothetical protein